MILLLDTSSPLCQLTLIENGEHVDAAWKADRELAKGLLSYLETELGKQGKTFADVTGIGAFKGPGSFTGLRIGLTVLNTLAGALHVPIVGAEGGDWRSIATARLEQGESDQIVLPLYGSDAHITPPRK